MAKAGKELIIPDELVMDKISYPGTESNAGQGSGGVV